MMPTEYIKSELVDENLQNSQEIILESIPDKSLPTLNTTKQVILPEELRLSRTNSKGQELRSYLMELERISLEDKLQEEMFLQDLDPTLIVAVLKDTMLNATTATPKGDLIPDYNARLAAIKTRKQLQRK